MIDCKYGSIGIHKTNKGKIKQKHFKLSAFSNVIRYSS